MCPDLPSAPDYGTGAARDNARGRETRFAVSELERAVRDVAAGRRADAIADSIGCAYSSSAYVPHVG